MFDFTEYREYVSDRAFQILSLAVEESRERKHFYLGIEHIFSALIKQEKALFHEIMSELNLDPQSVTHYLDEYLNVSKQYLGVGLKVPPATKNVFKIAWEEAQRFGRNIVEPEDIFAAIFQEDEGIPAKIFKGFGVEPDTVLQLIIIKAKNLDNKEEEIKKRFELPPHLKYFGVNLNKLARLGKLPFIVGRENEISQMMEILCHRERANSVMVIGEPGVGKTAIVEGLAMKLEFESQAIPFRLRAHQIVNLQMNSMVAGTIFRGMFEDRMEKIIRELKDRKNIILFIDEAHSLIGAGSAMGVPSDAANIFKSTLARGEIQIIGATTTAEYKTYIQEDEALARRFRTVSVAEPTDKETEKILKRIRPRVERNYSVKITDDAIDTCLTMSNRYMRAVRMPDKPISWMHTASVKVEVAGERKEVLSENIIDVISQEACIPRDMVSRDTVERFQDIESQLSQRVVGQQEAISSVARHLRLNKGPLKENFDTPDGVLLFLGPTGVGKTELGKALAEILFGDEKKMVRLDMSEYKDSSISVDKLIGMPRGIVGSERGGILSNQLRDNPYTVVLLDEMEKANHYVLNLFLQVFDEGWLTDGRGKRVYFSDAVIIMTSNLGSDEFKRFSKPMGFLDDKHQQESMKKAIMKEVENTFTPEFINRIDDIVVFSPLSREDVKKITKMYISKIEETLNAQNKGICVSERALDHLVGAGYSQKYGARFLKRTIDEKVKIPITLHWKEGSKFIVDVEDERLVVHWN
ncbi:MAG: ATP-dependent Clp protease ATP-binding subunit [Thermodesulfobacteriota bacterium]|nr:ATP-dependent Clp protease ATP-binding subunit [Thermodesulfobacteriota bacterium]